MSKDFWHNAVQTVQNWLSPTVSSLSDVSTTTPSDISGNVGDVQEGSATKEANLTAEQQGSEQNAEQVEAACCPPPRWMPIAWNELGVSEIAGPETNPRVMEYHEASGFTWARAQNGETPRLDDSRSIDAWCSSFVTWVLKQAGYAKNKLADDPFRARMWHDSWPHGVNTGRPIYGCLGVQKSHVGFIVGHKEGDPNTLAMLGGNQSNTVKVSYYHKSKFKGFWVPDDYPHACCELNVYTGRAANGDGESTR
ncbi:TIGR02594 family protein [Celeribacter ethanolicus]|uniref:TIGR02594 family protein n=1 Tax=Celeribacter ethanolicus TaxID=1758178 RepID=UPI0012FE40C7|nr:TIGR02594 family protein [Celeribacter ethanolicus]